MPTKILNLLGILAASGGLVVSQPLLASESVDFTKILAGTSVVEMPAKAASLVAKAEPQKGRRNITTIAVVKAAVRLKPTATVAVVGAISHAAPEMAPVAAVTAVLLQPKQLTLIAKAAAEAAPAQAGKIVAALIREFPSSYAVIAIAASEGAPQSGKEILEVVADYVPALQAGISSAVSAFQPPNARQTVAAYSSSSTLPVQAILVHAVNQAGTVAVSSPISPPASSATPAASPDPAPPFTPIVGPVTPVSPSQTTPQAPGGRNYASP